MDSLFATRRKFTWSGCVLCSTFTVILLGTIGYGGSVLAEAGKKTRSSQISLIKDQIQLWNESLPVFKEMNVSIQAENSILIPLQPDEKEDFHFKGVKLPPYPHFKFYANTTLLTPAATLRNVTSPSASQMFNLTTNLTVKYSLMNHSDIVLQTFEKVVVFQKTAVPLNQKMCNMPNGGIWDSNLSVCLRHFQLSALCLVFNSSTQAIDLLSCPSFTEVWKTYHWSSLNPPMNFSFLVVTSLRSDMDPLVFSERTGAGKLSPSSVEFMIMGCILIVVGCLFLLVPLIYFWQVFRTKERLLQKFDLEMSNIKEGYQPRY